MKESDPPDPFSVAIRVRKQQIYRDSYPDIETTKTMIVFHAKRFCKLYCQHLSVLLFIHKQVLFQNLKFELYSLNTYPTPQLIAVLEQFK